MINMANKIRVANTINEIKIKPKNYLPDIAATNKEFLVTEPENYSDYSRPFNVPLCLNNNNLSTEIKNESHLNNYIVPSNYYKKLISNFDDQMPSDNKLQNKVESLFCKDYINASNIKGEIFDKLFQKVF